MENTDFKGKRKCTGCNAIKDKEELIKITKVKDSSCVIVNPTSHQFGRSAYICKNNKCLEDAFKKGRIFKILKIKPDDLLKEKIRAVLEN